MTIYVAIVEDRHTDVEVHLFSTAEKAIEFAEGVMEYNSDSASYVDPDDMGMSPEEMKDAGWLFYGCYSTEGDCVRVLSKEVD